jgi:hypothetical protein
MAVNTRDRRMSMIGIGQPVPSVLPNPDGTIGTQDRAMFIWLYHGIALQAVAAVIALILLARSTSLTLESRSLSLTLPSRSLSLSLPTRD